MYYYSVMEHVVNKKIKKDVAATSSGLFLYQSRDKAVVCWVRSSSNGPEVSAAVFLTLNGLNKASVFPPSNFLILILNMCVLGFLLCLLHAHSKPGLFL